MSYIYVITNDVNGKQYVGKTNWSIEKRFKEHVADSKKERCEKRPLYNAMNKYGIEHFSVEELEQCDESIVNEREQYWIKKLGTYGKTGYNATLGGDSRHYADYNLIYALWQEGKTNLEIQNILNYDSHTIKTALKNRGVSKEERVQRGRAANYQSVAMLDKNTLEILRIFPSVKSAYDFLNKQHSGHISAVCNGKRETAYGYSWKYIGK